MKNWSKLKIKFDKTKPDGMPKMFRYFFGKKIWLETKGDFHKGFEITFEDYQKIIKNRLNLIFTSLYLSISPLPGDYYRCNTQSHSNSEVKPFCADGTLS